MDPAEIARHAMAMNDRVWHRHANPWSVYTRMPILALLALAAFSRVWLGWWALLPVALVLVWAFLNPRVFPENRNWDSWAARVTLGERCWLTRKANPVPPEHARMAWLLSGLSGVGLLVIAYGVWVLDPWATVAGVILGSLAKLWFCDRMVWLYDDLQAAEKRDSAGSSDKR